jgi:hypothetical protein
MKRRVARVPVDRWPGEPWAVYASRLLALGQGMRVGHVSLDEADRVDRLAMAAYGVVRNEPGAEARVASLLERFDWGDGFPDE